MSDSLFLQRALDKVLCCPFCKCKLRSVNEERLECVSCHYEYAFREGILVLMAGGISKEQAEEHKLREESIRQYSSTNSEEILKVVSQHHSISTMSNRGGDFRAKFNPSHWILDVGCGTGYYWRNSLGGNLILMDFAFENLKAAKMLLNGQNEVIFIQADAANLPIMPNSISGIWSVQATQHFPDSVMSSFINEANRILKNKFLIEIYNLNPSLMHKVLYKATGKKLHIKGKMANMILNRLDSSELIAIWDDIASDAKPKVKYSELLFHPDLHFSPKGKYVTFIENILIKMPWLVSFFARQIQIKISSGF